MNKHDFRQALHAVLIAFAATSVLALGGCALGDQAVDLSKPPPAGKARFVNDHYRLVLVYPDSLVATHAFESDYFLGNRWNPDADRGIPGSALLSLTLPGSNKIRRAVLRLGASDDARAVDDCTYPTDREQVSTVRLGGVLFTRADHGDAGMNHYSQARSYRGVYANECIAIDLFVTGTHAGVYDNPPEPAFTARQGMRRLEGLLDGLSFQR